MYRLPRCEVSFVVPETSWYCKYLNTYFKSHNTSDNFIKMKIIETIWIIKLIPSVSLSEFSSFWCWKFDPLHGWWCKITYRRSNNSLWLLLMFRLWNFVTFCWRLIANLNLITWKLFLALFCIKEWHATVEDRDPVSLSWKFFSRNVPTSFLS